MKYLVIGANAAGMSFVAKLKRNNPQNEIIVIEKNNYISLGACGLPYYVGNYFNVEKQMIARTVEEIQKIGVDIRINEEVVNVDYHNKIVKIKKGNEYYNEKYEKLIISSGAQPIIFPNVQKNNKNIFTLTTLSDGLSLKKILQENIQKNIGIIGTGFIGLELMDSLLNYNHQITIITKDDHIMQNVFSKDIVEEVEEKIINNKQIILLKNKNILKIEEKVTENKINVNMEDSKLDFDILIFAMGFKPNTNFIQQIDKLPNGAIITNDKCETSIPNIYALGDCATVTNAITKTNMYLPLATTANKLGRMLADYLSGNEIFFEGMLGSSCIKILDYELARTGLNEQECIDNNIKYQTKIIKDKNQTDYYPGQENIMAKIIYEQDSFKILGIEMIGKKGVIGRVDAISVAILNQMTTKQLGYIDFAYSPPFARTWDFLNVIGNAVK